MTCSACTGAVEATLGGLTGVSAAAVSLLTNTAEVLHARTLPAALCTAVCWALVYLGRGQAMWACRGPAGRFGVRGLLNLTRWPGACGAGDLRQQRGAAAGAAGPRWTSWAMRRTSKPCVLQGRSCSQPACGFSTGPARPGLQRKHTQHTCRSSQLPPVWCMVVLSQCSDCPVE